MMNPHTTCSPVRLRASSPGLCRAFTLVELVIVIGLILLLVAITVTVSVGIMRQSEVRETQNVITVLDNAIQEWMLQDHGGVTYGRGRNHGFDFGEPCGTETQSHIYRLPQLSSAGTTWTPASAYEVAQQETDFFIATLLRRPVFEDMIASIDSRYIKRLEVIDPPEDQHEVLDHFELGYLDFTPQYIYRFLDAWERPILAIHPGRAFDRDCNADVDDYAIDQPNNRYADEDGTIRTPLENAFGVGESRRIFFVSAGPNERFGLLHLDVADGSLTQPQRQQVDHAGDNIYSYPVEIDRARPQ